MGRCRAVINNGPLGTGGLVFLEILVERFDGASNERLGPFFSMLSLGQFNEQPASWKQRICKSLLERAESVAAFFDGSAEFHAVPFPFTAHRLDVIDFECHMLHALPVL